MKSGTTRDAHDMELLDRLGGMYIGNETFIRTCPGFPLPLFAATELFLCQGLQALSTALVRLSILPIPEAKFSNISSLLASRSRLATNASRERSVHFQPHCPGNARATWQHTCSQATGIIMYKRTGTTLLLKPKAAKVVTLSDAAA